MSIPRFFLLGLLCVSATAGAAAWSESEEPGNIIHRGPLYLRNLLELDTMAGTKAKLSDKEMPWSGHYWPFNLGMLGHRYASSFRGSQWADFYYEFMEARPASSVINQGTEAIARLSPAEKYDLLVGGRKTTWPLTKYAWSASQKVIEEIEGRPTGWEGLCHGWAGASIYTPRAEKKIVVQSSDGLSITFWPQDIKALATLFWSGNFNKIFLGNRCEETIPEKNRQGRIVNAACNDLNAGAWHLVALNELGVGDTTGKKHSFVVDIEYRAEVWNQPAVGYDLRYFNPQTNVYSPTLKKEQIIPVGTWSKDPFVSYHAPGTHYVVGVRMDLSYAVASPPMPQEKDSATDDRKSVKSFVYYLELDADYNIVGGEWMWPDHPDFLWSISDVELQNINSIEYLTQQWQGGRFPSELTAHAETSARYGQPLLMVVNELVKRSK